MRASGDKAHLSQGKKGHPETRLGPGRSTVVFSLVSIISDVQGETGKTAASATGDNQFVHNHLGLLWNERCSYFDRGEAHNMAHDITGQINMNFTVPVQSLETPGI